MNKTINSIPIENWYSGSYPMIVGGPCSAESEKQVMETAMALSEIPQIGIFRAGIWKPRTRPEEFEGVGIQGLKWLQNVNRATGLLTAVEIGHADHVKACLDHEINIIWIGARTVVNPFSMQEIAEVLHNADLPVFIKNPVNPDLKLWIGALERINQAGINKLVAVHRGFYTSMTSAYRNEPMWNIPIELKRMNPDLPIICDPSHISGQSNMVQSIAQQALDMGMDGLMIESHIEPDKALTDGEQQLTPAQFKKMIHELRFRKTHLVQTFEQELTALRGGIDLADAELINALSKRMKIVKRIAQVKLQNDMPAFQVKRWQEVRSKFIETGEITGLDKKFLEELLDLIHQESIRIQSEIFSDPSLPLKEKDHDGHNDDHGNEHNEE